jgi:hypothetical protein
MLFAAPIALAAGRVAIGGRAGWKWSRVSYPGFHGVFLTKGNKCLAIYRDRCGNALTYWCDLTRQKLPWAAAFPYGGEYRIQRAVWK